MSEPTIILRADFSRTRYMGMWLERGCWWRESDLPLLAAACDMGISYSTAADHFGRNPEAVAWKARDIGLVLPREWRDLIRTVKTRSLPRADLQYPFILKPDGRHSDIIEINRIVSAAMPGREDVCQDIMMALWESRISLAELRNDPAAVRSFIKSFRKTNFERGGYAESLDMTVHADGDGRVKHDDARYQGGVDSDFTDRLIDSIDAREVAREVPAALWMRVPRKTKALRVRRPKAPRSMIFHAELKKWIKRDEL